LFEKQAYIIKLKH